MDATSNLNLPFIAAAQAQKHVTHNEALRALDAVVQLMVLDKDLAAPPGAPAEGARYIVADAPSGAWSGQAGQIAAWQDGAWAFYAPREGWLAWVADEARLYTRGAGAWAALPAAGLDSVADDPAPQLGGPLDANGQNIAFDDGTGIADAAGNAHLLFHAAASAANHLAIANAPSGSAPLLAAEGTDPNIDLRLSAKGTGIVRTTGQLFVSSASFPPLRMERLTGNTASVVGGEQLVATSSGNMTDGFGVNLNFSIQDDAAIINEIGSLIFVRSGADNSGRFQLQPYNAGVATTRLEIAPGGNTYFPGVGTTASAANAVLNNGSSPANELLRVTSSLQYKTDVTDLDASWKRIIRLLRPISYRSKAPADNKAVHWLGLIAEEVTEIDPRLVIFTRDADSNLVPDAVQYDRLTVLLLKAVQWLISREEAKADAQVSQMSQ